MSLMDYVMNFPKVQLHSASLGAWQVYLNTAMILIALLVIVSIIYDYRHADIKDNHPQ